MANYLHWSSGYVTVDINIDNLRDRNNELIR
jgi:hypothetical protein